MYSYVNIEHVMVYIYTISCNSCSQKQTKKLQCPVSNSSKYIFYYVVIVEIAPLSSTLSGLYVYRLCLSVYPTTISIYINNSFLYFLYVYLTNDEKQYYFLFKNKKQVKQIELKLNIWEPNINKTKKLSKCPFKRKLSTFIVILRDNTTNTNKLNRIKPLVFIPFKL